MQLISNYKNFLDSGKTERECVKSIISLAKEQGYKDINDFNLLSQIDNSKTVEMALSFDNQYSFDEVNELINSDLINFYWVDYSKPEENISFYKEKSYNCSY